MRKKTAGKISNLEKYHNIAVERIAEEPEILGIDGLNLKSLVYKPIKFPELKRKGKETGDLILIWASPSSDEWEILVIELTVGVRRHLGKYFPRLKMSFDYFHHHWKNWFKNLGLELPGNYSLWVRTVAANYGNKWIWEKPFMDEKRRCIFIRPVDWPEGGS